MWQSIHWLVIMGNGADGAGIWSRRDDRRLRTIHPYRWRWRNDGRRRPFLGEQWWTNTFRFLTGTEGHEPLGELAAWWWYDCRRNHNVLRSSTNRTWRRECDTTRNTGR